MAAEPADEDRPGDAARRTVQPHWKSVDIYGSSRAFLAEFGRVPRPVGHLIAALWCDSEVCNGGFHQFFSNSTGILAPESAEGFRAIGLAASADVIEQAIAMFGEPFPRDRGERLARLSQLVRPGEDRREWDPFDELDDRFYAAKRQHDFYKLADRYASKHAG